MIILPYKWPKLIGWVECEPGESFPMERFIVYISEHRDAISRINKLSMKYIDSDNRTKEWFEYQRKDDFSHHILDKIRDKWPSV